MQTLAVRTRPPPPALSAWRRTQWQYAAHARMAPLPAPRAPPCKQAPCPRHLNQLTWRPSWCWQSRSTKRRSSTPGELAGAQLPVGASLRSRQAPTAQYTCLPSPRTPTSYPIGRARMEALAVIACACIMSIASIEVIQYATTDLVDGLTKGVFWNRGGLQRRGAAG